MASKVSKDRGTSFRGRWDNSVLCPNVEGLNVLVVGAGSDNGWVLGLISFLVHGGQSFSNGIIHGFDVSTSIAESMKANFRKLDAEYGVTVRLHSCNDQMYS